MALGSGPAHGSQTNPTQLTEHASAPVLHAARRLDPVMQALYAEQKVSLGHGLHVCQRQSAGLLKWITECSTHPILAPCAVFSVQPGQSDPGAHCQ